MEEQIDLDQCDVAGSIGSSFIVMGPIQTFSSSSTTADNPSSSSSHNVITVSSDDSVFKVPAPPGPVKFKRTTATSKLKPQRLTVVHNAIKKQQRLYKLYEPFRPYTHYKKGTSMSYPRASPDLWIKRNNMVANQKFGYPTMLNLKHPLQSIYHRSQAHDTTARRKRGLPRSELKVSIKLNPATTETLRSVLHRKRIARAMPLTKAERKFGVNRSTIYDPLNPHLNSTGMLSQEQIKRLLQPNLKHPQVVAKDHQTNTLQQNVPDHQKNKSLKIVTDQKNTLPQNVSRQITTNKQPTPSISSILRMLKASTPIRKRPTRKVKAIPNALFQKILSFDINMCMKQQFLCGEICTRWEERNRRSICLKSMDPLVLYGINLHRYANNMYEMIRVVELAIESNLIPPRDDAPPLPEKHPYRPIHTFNNLNFMSPKVTAFSAGITRNFHPELTSTIIREILSINVAALLAFLGFETTHQSVLDVLVDVLIEFLHKIAYRFKLAHDDMERGWMNDFPNIAERVLVELGMGGCRQMHDYYQSRVLKYINVLERHCEDLNKRYKGLLASKASPVENIDICDVEIKQETEEEILEIDLPHGQIALNEEVDMPSLDAGYQLLNTLEADT